MAGVIFINMDNWSVFNGQKRLFYRKKKNNLCFYIPKSTNKVLFFA